MNKRNAGDAHHIVVTVNHFCHIISLKISMILHLKKKKKISMILVPKHQISMIFLSVSISVILVPWFTYGRLFWVRAPTQANFATCMVEKSFHGYYSYHVSVVPICSFSFRSTLKYFKIASSTWKLFCSNFITTVVHSYKICTISKCN